MGWSDNPPGEAGSVKLSTAALWIMCSSSVEGPRNESKGALGDFNGL